MWDSKMKLFLFVCVIVIMLTLVTMRFMCHTKTQPVTQQCGHVSEVGRNRTIPRILHFIWNNESIPNEFAENIRGFAKNNPYPQWEYYFWTKTSTLNFVKDKYPFLYDRMSNPTVTSDIMRSDMLRYLILHRYGGAYFDLDTVSVKPLYSYFETHECSFAMEPGEHFLQWKTDLLLTNAAMLCIPGHPFYELIIWQLSQLSYTCTNAFGCTGPQFLTSLYRQVNRTTGVVSQVPDIQPSDIFQDAYDIAFNEKLMQKNCMNTRKLSPQNRSICQIWKARGMKNRTLSEKALTYHTWYHTNTHSVTYSESNGVFKVLPRARIYGQNL